MKRKFDIEGYFNALRPRMKNIAGSGGLSTTVPPHHHHAMEIVADPEPVDALLSADDVQEALQELGMEKLARSGEQVMLGTLPMDDNEITGVWNLFLSGGVGDANITGVRDVSFVGGVGEGVIDQPRVIHMTGDDGDNEARIDGLDRTVFNAEVTQGVIQDPSRIDFNAAVAVPHESEGAYPGGAGDYAAREGTVSWDAGEDTLVAHVVVGHAYVDDPIYEDRTRTAPIPLGWGMRVCEMYSGGEA